MSDDSVGEDSTYGQTPALPLNSDTLDEVSQYLLSVRTEASEGPIVSFIKREEEEEVNTSYPVESQSEGVSNVWFDKVLEEFLFIKQQLQSTRHIPVSDTSIPATTSEWRKFLLEEPPEISYFFTAMNRQDNFKLLAHITRWLSITSRPTLSQWIWKLFLRIDNTLDANETSTIRDLGKKALKIKAKQSESETEVDSISKYTVDMILIIIGKYFGQLDLLS
ncbi:hypothetical protein SBY92_003498 [Candida maltosa Xu316]|uniref:Uncharacterized protein n=1 Tax=Candida maltosa (strain Xu316) TaxID=1245528 RepID=M3JTN8_CANMX|nr:hypothetical protein G210_4075 [Candida maltosa Xu316]